MIKTRIVEMILQSDGLPPLEEELGYVMLPEPIMERKPPQPDANGKMPAPVLVSIEGQRYFVIGYTYEIPLGDVDDAPEAVYVLIVQAVPKPSSLVIAGPGAMDQIKTLIPEPGKPN